MILLGVSLVVCGASLVVAALVLVHLFRRLLRVGEAIARYSAITASTLTNIPLDSLALDQPSPPTSPLPEGHVHVPVSLMEDHWGDGEDMTEMMEEARS